MNGETFIKRNEKLARRAPLVLRGAICRSCYRRPRGSECAGPNVPRGCEAKCELFRQLPVLLEALECADPMIHPPHRVVAARIEQLCPKPGAHHYGALWLYRQRIARLLGRLLNA